MVYQPGWDDAGERRASAALVRVGDWSRRFELAGTGASQRLVADVTSPVGLPRVLDLALVIDTTGSMNDELEYLKVELRDISKQLHRAFPGVRQRFAFVAYRDYGDLYVTRRMDFTSSLDDFVRAIGAQEAGGGGDEPEAVHRALANASELSSMSSATRRRTPRTSRRPCARPRSCARAGSRSTRSRPAA